LPIPRPCLARFPTSCPHLSTPPTPSSIVPVRYLESESHARYNTREMSVLRGGGVIGAKPALTLPPIAGVRRTNELETRMTATIAEKKVT